MGVTFTAPPAVNVHLVEPELLERAVTAPLLSPTITSLDVVSRVDAEVTGLVSVCDQVVAPEDSTKAVTAPAEPLLDET